VKPCFLPIYSPLCDASHGYKFIGQVATWPEELSDNYTVVFLYYNTGNKETVDVNEDYTYAKRFQEKMSGVFLNFYRDTVRLDHQLLSSCGGDQ